MPRGRQEIEFYCNNCANGGGWFIINLNMNLRGAVIIVCPKCAHEHYRTFRDGEMKSDKMEAASVGAKVPIDINHDHGKNGATERITSVLSSWSSKPRIDKIKVVPCGFMNEKWMEKAAREKGLIDSSVPEDE